VRALSDLRDGSARFYPWGRLLLASLLGRSGCPLEPVSLGLARPSPESSRFPGPGHPGDPGCRLRIVRTHA